MTCTTCRNPHRLAWRSTVIAPGGTRSATLCAGCRATWRRRMLADLCEDVGRTHTAARLRGERCPGVCAACDAIARSEAM